MEQGRRASELFRTLAVLLSDKRASFCYMTTYQLQCKSATSTFQKVHIVSGARIPERLMVRVDKEVESMRIHRALNHSLRRRIVQLLGQRGSMSFTDLKGALSVRVGTLYYHFETLAPLIAQDERKRYVLTPLGSKAYQLMSAEETEARSDFKSIPSVGLAHHAKNLLSPPSYFALVYSRPKFGMIAAVVFIAVGTYLFYGAKLEPVMFFLDRAPTTQQSLIPFGLLASWVTVYLLSELLATGLFRRRGDHHLLFIGTAFAFGPLFVLPALILLGSSLSISLSLIENTLFERGILVIFQAWSIIILTNAIAVSKGLGIEKAAVIALAIAYVNILLLYVLGRIG